MTSDFYIIVFTCFVLMAVLAWALFYVMKIKKNSSLMLRQLDNYNSIIDQANDAMIVMDIVDGSIHQANASAAKLLGYSEFELTQTTFFEIHPKEYFQRSSSIVADVWEKGGLIYKDVPFVTKTGELIPVECSAKVAPFAGRPAIVIYARDIRERMRLEQEITQQRTIIDARNKDIRDSIEYSKRIQESVFLEKDRLAELAPDSFIFFKPREVVSGDFYWFAEFHIKSDSPAATHYKPGSDILVLAAVDCTGHGVPGAFVSIIGNALLNRAINDKAIFKPAEALDHMNDELKTSLNKNKNVASLRDGMDIALCFIDLENKTLEYAGANNPIYVIRKVDSGAELLEFKADKQSITASDDIELKSFSNKEVKLQSGDIIYLFTDGYADQFGGTASNKRPDGKKFLHKRFKETLLKINDQSMSEQKLTLEKVLADWQGDLQQVDDVLVIGLKIS